MAVIVPFTIGTMPGPTIPGADFDANFTALANAINAINATGAMQLIQTQTVSGVATVQFTTGFTSLADQYIFVISNILSSSAGSALSMRVSEDGGATYKALNYKWANFVTSDAATNNSTGSTSATSIQIMAGISATAGQVGATQIQFYNPAPTAVLKNVVFQGSNFGSGGNVAATTGSGMYAADGNPVNAVQFFMSAGNISATLSLYQVGK